LIFKAILKTFFFGRDTHFCRHSILKPGKFYFETGKKQQEKGAAANIEKVSAKLMFPCGIIASFACHYDLIMQHMLAVI
jgi:hypothetical protein